MISYLLNRLSFFNNREFNQFYFSNFVISFGESLVNIFIPIYLFQQGFPIYLVLIFYFLEALYFLVFSYKAANIVSKIGPKQAILFSGPFFALYILGLAFINYSFYLFFLIPIFVAIRATLFNYSFDLIFLKNSESHKIGRELAALNIFILIASATAPFLGGLLSQINFVLTFTISMILVIGGSIPLFFSKDSKENFDFNFRQIVAKIFSEKERGNFISFSGYAIEATIGRIIWPVFIILIVGSIQKTGLLISLSFLISIFVFYFIGKITDRVNKVSLLKVGTILYFLGWLGRIFADTAKSILFIDSYKNVSENVLHIPWGAQTYELAKRENPFEFVIFRQIIFNFIRIIVLPVLVIFFYIDFYPFVMSFITASIFSLGYLFINK